MQGNGLHAEARIERAALEASAVVGYSQLSVETIIERAGVSRSLFYRLYDNRADCFARAYAREADSLVARLVAGCRSAADWKRGLDTALAELAAFAVDSPLLANAVVAQARLGEGSVMDKRAEVLATLTAATDEARRHSDFSPPPIAAPFVVGAIEGALASALLSGKPEEFIEGLPALRYIALATFFGPEQAKADLDLDR
ncbi:MAG TPA: TetR/AcrR family transcriptional regulator [Solirubrobacterales bacterium]|nr:TetR/AcrR family transcriptional regulator [Solirubrobacterales bacterium]